MIGKVQELLEDAENAPGVEKRKRKGEGLGNVKDTEITETDIANLVSSTSVEVHNLEGLSVCLFFLAKSKEFMPLKQLMLTIM